MGSARKDLLGFPEEAVAQIGYLLGFVQLGGTPPSAKPWKGAGPGVLELVEEVRGDAFRVVYAVRFEHAIYVLHCFQKKSPSGRRTAATDVALILRRLEAATADYEVRYGQER